MLTVIDDVACTVCGCVCDDLRVSVEGGRVVAADRACRLAEPWLLGQNTSAVPAATVDGVETTVERAIDRAATILGAAKSPLVYGLSRSATAGQRAAVALAEHLGACIDTTASLGHAPSVMALQQVGESTCSLGEIRNRADLVIYWGSDPAETHPRHMERYSADPVGEFLPGGRADRHVLVIDETSNRTAASADGFIRIDRASNFEALWSLRHLVRGGTLPGESRPGADPGVLRALADRMKSCRCGVIFFGWGVSRSGVGHRSVEALLSLVTDLNRFTRFYARRMRSVGDVTGADLVLAWQTGFPFSVSFSRGYPRYNPGEFSAVDLLERGDVDACLFVGSETVQRFSAAARRHLTAIPTITLDVAETLMSPGPTVRFTTAAYGIHRPGTVYRMDEVPIPVKTILPSGYPSDEDILTGVLAAVRRRQPGA